MSVESEDGRKAAVPEGAALRIDRWLCAVRLYKSRSLAAQAVSGGRVHVNGARVKPARAVRAGDQVSLTRGALTFDCEVIALPARRGPASAVAGCYRELPASIARRAEFSSRMRLTAALAPRPETRPDKHARRLLRRARGRD